MLAINFKNTLSFIK